MASAKSSPLVIIGLGNPGKRYQFTIHNFGYLVIDALFQEFREEFTLTKLVNSQVFFSKKFQNQDQEVILIKPSLFMNLSGTAVLEVFYRYQVKDKTKLLIVHDDVDINNDEIRLSFNRSAAGHNGVNDIINRVGNGFWRLRGGFKKTINLPTISAVLLNLENKKEKEILLNQVESGKEKVLEWIKKQEVNHL